MRENICYEINSRLPEPRYAVLCVKLVTLENLHFKQVRRDIARRRRRGAQRTRGSREQIRRASQLKGARFPLFVSGE